MGNFEDHMRWAFGAHIVAVLVAGVVVSTQSLPLLWLLLAATGLPITLAGGAFPDIDHHASKPNRIFKNALTLGTGIAGGYASVTRGASLLTATAATYELPAAVGLGAGAVVGAIVIGVASRLLFDIVRPTHRGITHRVPTGLLVSAGVGSLILLAVSGSTAVSSPVAFGVIGGGLFFTGVLSHLACDGMLTSLDTYVTLR